MRAAADNVADVLAVLEARPQTIGSIRARTGLATRRIQEAIEAARRTNAAAVCSDGRGYWLARDTDEYRRNVEARRNRIATQAATIRAERRLVRRLMTPGQVPLW